MNKRPKEFKSETVISIDMKLSALSPNKHNSSSEQL